MLSGLGLLMLSSMCPLAAVEGLPDAPFIQETHEPFPIHARESGNDVITVAVDRDDAVWAGTKDGAFRLNRENKHWKPMMHTTDEGPVFELFVDRDGVMWAGAWNGLYRMGEDKLDKIEDIDDPIAAICETDSAIIAIGPDGIWRGRGGAFEHLHLPCAQSIRAAVPDTAGAFWIGTANGLYFYGPEPKLYQAEDEILSADVAGAARAKDGSLWTAGMGGITVFKDGKRTAHFTTGEDALPTPLLNCIACAPDGTMWIGTAHGVVRRIGDAWSVRSGQRWLISDKVHDIAFDSEGTAWVGTAKGVSAIKRRAMTLAEKAEYFHGISLERHTRAPWIVERCRLRDPGDISSWTPEDDDNDGGYTATYLVMESFRYAVTKHEEARENARKAFKTLELLQTITETPGFFARTIVPGTWTNMHDPGDSYSAEEWAQERIRDPRCKKVEVRWRPSKDGKWLWKGDTSSDEATAHFYSYGYYFDFAADDAEKAALQKQVRAIMDYIIDGGYVLRDVDGEHTRWGVWAPDRLNRDPNWASERNINSAEILSYLKCAYHITGDEKYQNEYLRLIRDEHYGENMRHAKTYAPAWRTHIDDELLAFVYPALLRYETDPELLKLFRESLDHWYEGVKNDASPLFDFIYASLINAPPPTQAGIEFLRDAPLDLIEWTVDNSKREDIHLIRSPEMETLQTSRLLPASERGVMRWDKNPWAAVQGDRGRSEWCPTFWLLPYWMGRHYGYIQAPK